MKPNFRPKISKGLTFLSSYTVRDGKRLVNERVCFVPDVDINCDPPYVKGQIDFCWVKYVKGERPTTKEGWERILGMSIQTML